jgi:hypothetical protein
MASAEEVEWKEDEDGNTKQVIKVRALDLPMLIHETVKAIYELIMANAIPDNEYLAKRIMAETDTLKDEKEDIKYGPFLAADIRDFVTKHLERMHKINIIDYPFIREHIYGYLVLLPANEFLEIIHAILNGDNKLADDLIMKQNIINLAIDDVKGESNNDYNTSDEQDDDLKHEGEIEDDIMLKPKEKSYADMSKSELDRALNIALEADDFETIKKITPYLQ